MTHNPLHHPSGQPTEPANRPTLNQLKLLVASAVNNDQILQANLAASPMIAQGAVPLIIQRGYSNASAAYNHVLDNTDADVVIFAHQDVYFPKNWDLKLQAAITSLEQSKQPWGVLGVVGINEQDQLAGCLWCVGNDKQFGGQLPNPTPVVSIDEVVIVVSRNTSVRFDPALPGFHLYATDIVLNAKQMGLQTYAFYAPVVHNTIPVRWLDRSFIRAYRYMQKKWRRSLPISNLIVPITATGWALREAQVRMLKRLIEGYRYNQHRLPSPSALAVKLGYEDP